MSKLSGKQRRDEGGAKHWTKKQRKRLKKVYLTCVNQHQQTSVDWNFNLSHGHTFAEFYKSEYNPPTSNRDHYYPKRKRKPVNRYGFE